MHIKMMESQSLSNPKFINSLKSKKSIPAKEN